MNRMMHKDLKQIRRKLHQIPEPSGREERTASLVMEELEKTDPPALCGGVGGHGVIARYGEDLAGPQLMFRSELDALPVPEKGDCPWKSQHEGFSHACGHDGHMAALIGLSRYLGKHSPPRGQVTLLFQPAEETGEGAREVLSDPEFAETVPDRSYSFHNLPGLEKRTLFYKTGPFAAASVGLKSVFRGNSSHAAYPGQGRNPSGAVAELIQHMQERTVPDPADKNFCLATVTYLHMGEKAFGISPGRAEVGITLRAARDQTLDELRNDIQRIILKSGERHGLTTEITEVEPFAATVNHPACVDLVLQAASSAGMDVKELNHPFPWSEDFGHFSRMSQIAQIGIGAGVDHPHLHSEEYDFPDDLLPVAQKLFTCILEEEWRQI